MRKSGILMHLSSLPGPYGIGTMGKAAREFVDFLAAAGQKCWQILPLSPTGFGNSPYQSFSTFAGNPYLIDLDLLIEDGLLRREEVQEVFWGENPRKVDFGALYDSRRKVLRTAFSRFVPDGDYERFCGENSGWLGDYALFMALKDRENGADWLRWERPLRMREPGALETARQALREEMELHEFLQYVFSRQWEKLHAYAAQKGIEIIGDVPIYVPLDSADVWAAPELFRLDENRRPTAVAGVPPDAFTADGQLWGNPLYDWEAMERTGYRWWLRRLSAASSRYDTIRLDHFRGFESYWSVPAGEPTARGGHWEKGPGSRFIRTIREAGFSCIAEDLGYVTPEVRALQEESGYPGMKVLEFAFDSREKGNYLPHGYPVNSVCYSGTHDNLTLCQWLEEADPADLRLAKDYLGLSREEGYAAGMIRGCMATVSELCIIQMQDWLELGGSARMNFPGTLSDRNWTWRAMPGACSQELAAKIRTVTERYGRAFQN